MIYCGLHFAGKSEIDQSKKTKSITMIIARVIVIKSILAFMECNGVVIHMKKDYSFHGRIHSESRTWDICNVTERKNVGEGCFIEVYLDWKEI